MSAAKILGDKDRNAHMAEQPLFKDVKSVEAKDVKSMEYHRQVLQSKVQCPYAIFSLLSTKTKH